MSLVKLWCETCSGTGEVREEYQRGVAGSGGVRNCPDCAGEGYTERAVSLQGVRRDGMPASATERKLRRLLCFQRHGHQAYMKDGEASWGGDEGLRGIDYMRESPEAIEDVWVAAARKALAKLAEDQPNNLP